ncbi:MAG TPA: SDR family NAD(P)-dependent oxidoreductase [Candidatus Dormibacteraeota bacterium]|nr:SDR family NAD(P)-dependent oxidoreductase [Candidatus Dormibacteraeota bacterium]
MTLAGRVALVTGAGSKTGLGNAIARALAAAGAEVVLADIDVDGATRNAAEIGAASRAIFMDVTDEGSVEAAVQEIGPVDILVNNAGVTQRVPIWELSIDDFDRLLSINLRGGFLCLRAVVAGMMARRWGRIIWISSVAGKQGGGIIGTAHYAASKAGIIGLCQAAARELGPYGITSNAIAPGFILTGIATKALDADQEAAIDRTISATAAVRRSGIPEDVAGAALFLASTEASYVTGEVIDVNGGIYFD